MTESPLEAALLKQIHADGLPEPQREGCLIDGRRYRVDFFWPGPKLVVEVEGFKGRHQFTGGFVADCEKYALLTLAGWRVLRVTQRQIRSGEAIEWIRRGLTQ